MRLSARILFGALLLSAAVAACTGNGTPSSGPNSAVLPSGSTVTLGKSTILQAFSVSGLQGAIVYPTGSGTLTGTVSATPPSGVSALMSEARSTKATATPAPNAALFYITYAGTATLGGLPGVSLTLPTAPPTGTTYYEAQWNGTRWLTVGGAGSLSGTTLTFNAGSTSIALVAGTPIYIAAYSGSILALPTPTPSPTPTTTATPSANVIADPGFESDSLTSLGTYPAAPVVTSSGWSQCSISRTGPSPSPYPFSNYTPAPTESPGSSIAQGGIAIASPAPPVATVPVHGGSYAAELGGYFYNYNLNDYTYNGVCQLVTIPANATLSMYVLGTGGNGTSTTTAANFEFVVDLLDTSNNFVANLYSEFNVSDTAYRQVTSGSTTGFAGLSSYSGHTYELFIGTWVGATGKRIGYYFVDDVSLKGS